MTVVRTIPILVAMLVGGGALTVIWGTLNRLLAGEDVAYATLPVAVAVVALVAAVAVIIRSVNALDGGEGRDSRGVG